MQTTLKAQCTATSNSMLPLRFQELLELQRHTLDQPYSIVHRLRLARVYRDFGYPDLAAGDAYKALLLIDEVVEDGEYHERAVEAALIDLTLVSNNMHDDCCCQATSERMHLDDKVKAAKWAKTCWSRTAYVVAKVF
jgi:hypothetical protein